MAARQNFYAESVGESSNNSTDDAVKVQLDFQPTANASYLLIWSAQGRAAATNQEIIVSLKDNSGTVIGEGIVRDKDVSDWHPLSGIARLTFDDDPAAQSVTLTFRTSSSSVTLIREARIITIRLTEEDAYVENNDDEENTTDTFATAVTLDWTPVEASPYLVLSSSEMLCTSSAQQYAQKTVVNNVDYGLLNGRPVIGTNRFPGMHAVYLPNSVGAQSALIQFARGGTSGTIRCRRSRIAAINLANFMNHYAAESRDRSTVTAASLQEKVALVGGTPGEQHLVLACCVRDHNSTVNSARTRLARDGTAIIGETSQEARVAAGSPPITLPMSAWGQMIRETIVSEATWTLDYYSSADGTVTGIASAAIVAIELNIYTPPPEFATAWPHKHNWRDPVLERYAWLTQVTSSWNGSESRRALRTFPRRVLEYAITATGVEAAAIDAALWRSGSAVIGLPLWGDGSALDSSVSIGATSLQLDVSNREFRAGGHLMLHRDWRTYEVATIAAAVGSTIELAEGLTLAWPAGTAVYPVIGGRPLRTHDQSRVTAGVADSIIAFEQTGRRVVDPGEPVVRYRGIEVLTLRPNRVRPIALRYERQTDRLESDSGIVTVDDRTNRPRTRQDLEFIFTDRESVQDYVRWLYRRQGQRYPFWSPTFQADLHLVAPAAEDDVVLQIRALDFTANYGAATLGRRDVAIRVAGATFYRRLVLVTAGDSGVELATIDEALGVPLEPGEVLISFLVLSRLAADTIELARLTAGVAQSRVPIISLDQDESDEPE